VKGNVINKNINIPKLKHIFLCICCAFKQIKRPHWLLITKEFWFMIHILLILMNFQRAYLNWKFSQSVLVIYSSICGNRTTKVNESNLRGALRTSTFFQKFTYGISKYTAVLWLNHMTRERLKYFNTWKIYLQYNMSIVQLVGRFILLLFYYKIKSNRVSIDINLSAYHFFPLLSLW
jgi:hypothetical protein